MHARSLAEVQAYVGNSIETLKAAGATDMLHLAMSIAEYLKDAARWRYVQEHYVEVLDADMGEMMPDQFKAWVDARIGHPPSHLTSSTTWHHPECKCGGCQTQRYLAEKQP